MMKALGLGIKSGLFLTGFYFGVELVRDEMIKLNISYDEYKEVLRYKTNFKQTNQSVVVDENTDYDKQIINDLMSFRERTLEKLKSS